MNKKKTDCLTDKLHICTDFGFERGQQLGEMVELPGIEQEIRLKLVGADGEVLLTQTMQLEV